MVLTTKLVITNRKYSKKIQKHKNNLNKKLPIVKKKMQKHTKVKPKPVFSRL